MLEERDSIVQAAINVLADDISNVGAAFFGMAVLNAELPMDDEQSVRLICLTVVSVVQNIDHEEAEPQDHFIDRIEKARQIHRRLPDDDRERLDRLVELGSEALARAYVLARSNQLDEAIDAYNHMMRQLSGIPSRRINQGAVLSAMDPIRKFCLETDAVLRRVHPFVADADLREFINQVMTSNTDLANRTRGPF
jgi:hypothetical protein